MGFVGNSVRGRGVLMNSFSTVCNREYQSRGWVGGRLRERDHWKVLKLILNNGNCTNIIRRH